MAVLLLAEWDKNGLAPESARALSAALQLQAPVDMLLIGETELLSKAQAAARRLKGLRTVLTAATNALEERLKTALAQKLAEPTAALLARQAEHYSVFIAAASNAGRNIMPRVAGLLGVAQISDIIGVEAADIFRRTIYAGNAAETVRALHRQKVITVRASAFPPAVMAAEAAAAAEEFACPSDLPAPVRFVSEKIDEADGLPDLNAAKIVVSGGRGFGSAEDFKRLLEPLAHRLNAAVGASRAAVDAGFIGNDRQVGQTGRIVSPELYFAIGLSGAAQHLAGMSGSRVIVAINKDPDAPIFQVADWGLVGDLFEILPELTELLPQQ